MCDQHWVKKDCNQARGVKLINILNTTVYCEDHFSKHWSNKMKTTWVQFFNWPIPVCIKFFNCSWLLHFWLWSTKEDDLLNYWERQTLNYFFLCWVFRKNYSWLVTLMNRIIYVTGQTLIHYSLICVRTSEACMSKHRKLFLHFFFSYIWVINNSEVDVNHL